jgi:hypothetical protein
MSAALYHSEGGTMTLSRWPLAVALAAGLALPVGAGAASGLNIAASAAGSGYLVEVSFDSPHFVEGGFGSDGGMELLLENAGWIGRPGAPDLPSVQRLFEMPDRSGVQLRLVDGDYELLAGIQVQPCQERLHTEAELPLAWLRDEALYATDAFWPEQEWELDQPALMRNHRVVKASFYPVQVNPVTQEARVWSRMVFELGFAGTDPTNARTFRLPERESPLDQLVKRQIVYPATAGQEPDRDLLFDVGALPGKYLVFANTTAQANPAFQSLMDWKRKKGHRVTLVSQNDVSFTANNIRNRIITEYNSAEPVDFVLLVGDTDGTYAIPSDGTTYDHFYAMIEGGDILGDVAVGRISVDNATQLAAVCNKILQYESTPYLDNDLWLRRAGLTVGSSVCALSMKILSRAIAAELVTRRGYTQIDSAFCSGSAHVDDWFIEGISFYNYRGWVGMEGLSMSTIQSLTQGPRTPVATIFTCGTGDFIGGDDYTEAFLNSGNANTPGGAVACMGFATLSTHTRYNNVVVGGYYSGLLEYDAPSVGACLLQGKYELYRTLPPGEQSNAASFAYWGNLMGDPGTDQWAGVPAPLAVNTPATLPLGANHLTLTVTSNGQPVPGVAVCAWQDQTVDLQVRGLTDANGQVTLNWSGLQAGTLHVTSTHHRYQPRLHQVTVTAGAAAPTLTAVGAGGGLLPGGGHQAVSLTIQNLGSGAMTGITLTPSLAAAWGSINNPFLTLATLAAGASHTFTGLTISPLGTLVHGTQIPLDLTLSSAQGSFPLQALVPVVAPLLSISSLSYPNGSLEPGQTRDARLGVRNDGTVGGTGVVLTMVSGMPDLVTVNSGPVSIGNLAAGASVPVNFSLTIAPLTNRGQPVPMQVEWTSQGGTMSGSFSFLLTIGGNLTAVDPTGPDAYGYWAYENTDNSPFAPEFSWYAISTPEGGPGIEIPMTDDGNEQDDGIWVSLPFPFTYYGRTYSQMMVCSNGFIAFEEDGFGEWDFRNHVFPSPMGPDAMIAPMWDDHLTTGAARGVWRHYDTAAQAFVISWYNLLMNSSGGPNSFQLVLYDPAHYPTTTGDGPFKFQYLTFNDNQSASADFPYCSIGIKDHSSTVGLTIRHWTQQPATTSPVAAGRAIYFSTLAGEYEDTMPPSVVIQPVGMSYAWAPQPVVAQISDLSGLAAVTLDWRLEGQGWSTLPMAQNGSYWEATIPGQAGGSVVEYFITAVDASEHANTTITPQASYPVSPATLIYADGFNGTSAFIHESGVGLTDEWHLETARAIEGSHCWKFGGAGTGTYSNNAGGILISPVMEIPVGASGITASIRSWIAAETSGAFPDSCYDGGKVEWRLNGGTWMDATVNPALTHSLRGTITTATLRAWFGWPRRLYSGVADWSPLTIAVPNGTTSLQLRWLFGTDTGTVREGWYLDDFRLVAALPESQPEPVTDLMATAQAGIIQLSWSPLPGALGYRVYASSTPYDENPDLLGQVPTPGYQEVIAGGQKFYTVRVVY